MEFERDFSELEVRSGEEAETALTGSNQDVFSEDEQSVGSFFDLVGELHVFVFCLIEEESSLSVEERSADKLFFIDCCYSFESPVVAVHVLDVCLEPGTIHTLLLERLPDFHRRLEIHLTKTFLLPESGTVSPQSSELLLYAFGYAIQSRFIVFEELIEF